MTLFITFTADTGATLVSGNPVVITAAAYLNNSSGGTIALYGPPGTAWNVTNAGLVVGKYQGIDLVSGTLTNAVNGVIGAGTTGVYIAVGATVTNAGIVTAPTGIFLHGGGSVGNQNTGTISAQTNGIDFFGGYGTVTNAGVIAGTNKYGIVFHSGGTVTNLSGGTISGDSAGVYRANTVTNAGLVTAHFNAIFTSGGSVINQSTGTLSGGGPAVVVRGSGSVTNAGLITSASAYGLQFSYGGNVINQSGGTIAGKVNGIVAGRAAVTIVNAGTIAGSKSAILLHSGYNNRVIADPGAVFAGTVNGGGLLGAYSTLELASGATPGQMSGLGSQFRNFARTTIDAGSMWTLTGSNYFIGGTTLTNAGELTVLNGSLAVAGTLLNNGLIQDIAATVTVAKLAGTGQVVVGAGGVLTVTGSVAATESITLGAGGVLQINDTVTNAGVIAGGTSAAGVQLVAGGTVTNLGIGTITGAADAIYVSGGIGTVSNAGSLVGTNFAGVFFSGGGGVVNQSSGTIIGRYDGIAITGGTGTVVNAGLLNGTSGDGILLSTGGGITNQSSGTISGAYYAIGVNSGSATVTNAGAILAAGSSGYAVFLHGGGAVANQSGGTIRGRAGGVFIDGGAASVANAGNVAGGTVAGVYLKSGGSVSNQVTGTISGNYGAIEVKGAAGTVTNAGVLTGTGQTGVYLKAGGGVTNQAGGAISGKYSGIYVNGAAGTVVNAGAVAGAGNDGIVLFNGGGVTNQAGGLLSGKYGVLVKAGAGTVTNGGTIFGSTEAVALPAGFANQVVVDPGAVFSGLVDGGNTIGATVTSTLELASAAAPGLISGLGTQFINFAQTTIDPAAQWTLTGTNTLVAGTTLTNTGALTLLDGGLADAGNVINDGIIQENAATLTVATLNGTGEVVIGGGSSLIVTGSIAATQTIVFAGNGVLDIASTAAAQFAGQLVLANGAKVSSQSAADTVSGIAQQSASVAVSGTGAAWTSAGQLQIGGSGLGEFAIQAGATATVGAGAVIAGPASASGSAINLSGAGSSLQLTGALDVGVAGFGGLSLIGGASVTAGSLDAGNSASGVGQISVSGAGSSLSIAGAATIADDGTGVLSVLNGASFSASSLAIGAQGTGTVLPSVAPSANPAVAGGSGIVSVVGNASNLTLSGHLTVGDASSAELSILSGAVVSAADADIGVGGSATGNVDIEGAGSHLNIAHDLNIGDTGVAVVTLGNGTELTVGNNLVVGANGVLNQFGGSIDPSTITIVAGGRQGGHGTSTASVLISNAGTLFASSGTETVISPLITAPSGKSGVLEIDAGGDMVLNVGSVDATQSVTFTDGTGILTIGTIGGFAASIVGVNAGDQIIVQGKSIASDSFNAGAHTLTLFDGASGTIGTLQLGPSVDGSAILANGTGGLGVAPCFMAGTRISTERGEVAVEDLRVGDRVQVVPLHPHSDPLPLRGRGGAELAAPASTGPAARGPLLTLPRSEGGLGWGSSQPITWIGHRTIDCARHPKPHQVHPVRIAAHSFGPNRPARDLYLSPDHALYLNNVLIPVKHLINGTTIVQTSVATVTYYHVELPAHAILLAENLPAESYLDTGDRANFANAAGPIALHPDFASRQWAAEGCAPLVVTGPELGAARRWIDALTIVRLAKRASRPA